ncbi:hypothetical protein QYM36_010182 [Artemia franciscana]|uniref:Ubiquitin-like domain-containing protein n=1 Tax=Artemia franciscana TaxID=6661 RepID=A0AA88HWI3_ARTSF|nr:hypothetical protein QYM36_010182 [Artemia franciscana]
MMIIKSLAIAIPCAGIAITWAIKKYGESKMDERLKNIEPKSASEAQKIPSSVNGESGKHKLFIDYSGKIMTVEVEPNAIIENVKKEIQVQLGIPKDEMLLVYNGKQLENDDAISDSNCQDLFLTTLDSDLISDSVHLFRHETKTWYQGMNTANSTEPNCIKTSQGKVFLRKGDLIEIEHTYSDQWKCTYQWAVYMGNMQVAYAEPRNNNKVMTGNLRDVYMGNMQVAYAEKSNNKKVKIENLQKVEGKHRWRINNSLDEIFPAFHEDTIVRRARKELNKENPKFISLLAPTWLNWLTGLTYSNSECFCHWVRNGAPISSQVLIFKEELIRSVFSVLTFTWEIWKLIPKKETIKK